MKKIYSLCLTLFLLQGYHTHRLHSSIEVPTNNDHAQNATGHIGHSIDCSITQRRRAQEKKADDNTDDLAEEKTEDPRNAIEDFSNFRIMEGDPLDIYQEDFHVSIDTGTEVKTYRMRFYKKRKTKI